jgi:hypothetical protein
MSVYIEREVLMLLKLDRSRCLRDTAPGAGDGHAVTGEKPLRTPASTASGTATLDGVPRPLPWARCAETLVRAGPESGHRPHKAIRDEDYAGANRLMWPVEDSRKRL